MVETHGLSLAMLEAGEKARGPNAADSHLVSWMRSGAFMAGAATTVVGRRRPVASAEVIEPDSGRAPAPITWFHLAGSGEAKVDRQKRRRESAVVAIHVVRAATVAISTWKIGGRATVHAQEFFRQRRGQ
jgi:hypothetical protein